MVDVFVDTSAWYALRVLNDEAHPDSRRILERLAKEGARLHTSDWVLLETVALLGRRVGPQESVRAGQWLLSNPAVTVHPLGGGLVEAWDAYLKAAGRVSLVDCGSFTLMRQLGLSRAFAFDDDFEKEGFALET